MSFRDENEALRARADALQDENEQLRHALEEAEEEQERLEHEKEAADARGSAAEKAARKAEKQAAKAAKKAAKAAKKAAKERGEDRDDKDDDEPKSAVRKVLSALPFVAFFAFIIWFWGSAVRTSCNSRPPTLVRAMIVAPGDGSGARVALFWSRYQGHSRTSYFLSTYDAASGKKVGQIRLAKGVRRKRYRLRRPVGGRVWAIRGRQPELVDLRRPAVLLSAKAIAAKVPALARGYRLRLRTFTKYSPPTTSLPLVLSDGKLAWLDMTPKLLDHPAPTTRWLPGYYCGPGHGQKPSCERKHCYAFASRPGTTALVLGDMPLWGKRRDGTVKKGLDKYITITGGGRHNDRPLPASARATPLLRPGLVRRLGTACAFESDGRVLVIHDTAATGKKSALLSLLGADGHALWTLPFAKLSKRRKAEPLGAQMIGGKIVLLLGQRRRHTHKVDLVRLSPDGRVISRHALL